MGRPVGPGDAVRHAVAVFVRIARIGADEDFRAVGKAVAVGVGLRRVGSVEEGFVPVGKAVAVGVGVRVHSGHVLPFDRETRGRAQDAARAEQVRDGNAVRDGRAVHAPDGNREDAGSEQREGVHAVGAGLRADDGVRRGRVEGVREIVEEREVAGRTQLGLDGHAAAGQAVEQGVFPREDAAPAGRRVVPEPRTRAGVRPVRFGDHAERSEERRERGKPRAVRKRRPGGRTARRRERNSAVRGDVDPGNGIRPDAEKGLAEFEPEPAAGRPVSAPIGHFDRGGGFRAERHGVRPDLDRDEGRSGNGGRRRRPDAARRIVRSAGLRAARGDRGGQAGDDGGFGRKPRLAEPEQHFAHLRRAPDRPQNAVEAEAAPRGGQGDGDELFRNVVHGKKAKEGKSAHRRDK